MNAIQSLDNPETLGVTSKVPLVAAANKASAPCHAATSLAEVEVAWGLVYRRYTEMGLIGENPFGVHIAPTAVGRHSCVIWGPDGPDVGYTMTLTCDTAMGLALDGVYPKQLAEFRSKGYRLLEVGMLADRRHSAARSLAALCSMMRWAVFYTLHSGCTDVVIGVHPRHAQFYARYFGFEIFAPETSYPLVRNHPVVPLHLRLIEAMKEEVLPRGLADARSNPIPASAFASRFAFTPGQLSGSRIAGFMRMRYGIDVCAASAPAVPSSQPVVDSRPRATLRPAGAAPAPAARAWAAR